MKKLNNELSEWDDVVNKVNEIVGYINEQEPQPVTVLWVIRNKDTNELIFNARGGAYKDKEAALNKIKKLGSQNHRLLRYELVNEMRVSTGKTWRKI